MCKGSKGKEGNILYGGIQDCTLTTEYLEESNLVLKDIFEDEEKDIRIELEATVVRNKF